METVKVKVKKLVPEAVMPTKATDGSACYDLTAISATWDSRNECYVYGTGLAFEFPKGFVARLWPRSSNRKTNCYLTNSVGNCDPDYRGEYMVCFKDRDRNKGIEFPYNVGDRICQMTIEKLPDVEFELVDELSDTTRGEGGFGSTGK